VAAVRNQRREASGITEAMPFHHMHLHKRSATVITALADHITRHHLVDMD
jgi:hypothetical protein